MTISKCDLQCMAWLMSAVVYLSAADCIAQVIHDEAVFRINHPKPFEVVKDFDKPIIENTVVTLKATAVPGANVISVDSIRVVVDTRNLFPVPKPRNDSGATLIAAIEEGRDAGTYPVLYGGRYTPVPRIGQQGGAGGSTHTWGAQVKVTVGNIIVRAIELHNGNEVNNSIVVGDASGNHKLYICGGSDYRITLVQPEDSETEILYHIQKINEANVSGDLGQAVEVNNPMSRHIVTVGPDINDDGVLQSTEVAVKFEVVVLDFVEGQVLSQRISAPYENAFVVKPQEHYEVGGEFRFSIDQVQTPAGASNAVRWEVWKADGSNIIASGVGSRLNHTFAGGDQGDVFVRFYCDANDNEMWDTTESELRSATFQVKEMTVHRLAVDWSNKIGPFTLLRQNHLDERFRRGGDLLLRRDYEDDWRACVQFELDRDNSQAFTPNANRPDPIDTGDHESVTNHYNAPSDITYVQTITSVANPTDAVYGFAGIGQAGAIVLKWNVPSAIEHRMPHEFGHTLGFRHDGRVSPDIMKDNLGAGDTAIVDESEATLFE
jgi:hypothetical protein